MNPKLILLLLAMLVFKTGSSHAPWIEASPMASIGKKHHIKGFYGEIALNVIEPVNNCYSNPEGFKLFLSSPDLKMIHLDTIPSPDHFESSFIPESQGHYRFMIVHQARVAHETTAFESSSNAWVSIGQDPGQGPRLEWGISLPNGRSEVGAAIIPTIFSQGAPWPLAGVEVVSPTGWTKALRADQNGRIAFRAVEMGTYPIETSKFEVKKMDWYGKPVDKIWKGSTTAAIVKQSFS